MALRVMWMLAGALMIASCQEFAVVDVSRLAMTAGNKAKKETVMVVFTDKCPVDVLTIGADCPPELAGPGTVCRGGPNRTDVLKKITWVKDPEADSSAAFTITFPGYNPCDLTTTGNKTHCQIKNTVPDGITVAKYDVEAVGADCKLDPYIIVLN